MVDKIKENRNIDTDYETSRATYLDLMAQGQQALDLMMDVARESEHPRAFEVLSGLMKNIADVTDKLMDLNKKERDIKAPPKSLPVLDGTAPGITQNNVFIGTTDELQRMLQETDEPKIIDVTPEETNDS